MNPAPSYLGMGSKRRRGVAVLGSTGSIGANTLAVLSGLGRDFRVVALSADSNIELLSRQARRFSPKVIAVGDAALAKKIRPAVPARTSVANGPAALREIVSREDVDIAVFAISGSACILPLVDAIKSKKRIALANKESLVSAGEVIMDLARKSGVEIIPIDSEHSAIFQCLEGRRGQLRKIYLTGSGGPLLNIPKRDFDRLSVGFILRHPKWRMGRKISVDSATMMNKGLEIIEARWLFETDERSIDVLIHPEAIVHSMVELVDGTVFAQLAVPDMRIPIQYAVTYPGRSGMRPRRLDFKDIEKLSFGKPDRDRFPCLDLARGAVRRGGTCPAALAAADEEAVGAYLAGRIRFSRITAVIERVLELHRNKSRPSLEDILETERWAREEAGKLCYR
jgi:1-deoxy-D-xylulose-5-phosphate reductoisomerase